jgi:predicted nucleic acid-binding Zn ribbon protein
MTLHRRSPRPVGGALDKLVGGWQPDTAVARVQSTWSGLAEVWEEVVGDYVAQRAEPQKVAGGVLTVSCSESVVADTLNLESEDVLRRLNERLEGDPIDRLRCVTSGA